MSTIRHSASENKFVAVYKEAARIRKEEEIRNQKSLSFRIEREKMRKARKIKK